MNKISGISFLLGAITALLIIYGLDRCTGSSVRDGYAPVIEERVDTVIIRDTIRPPIPEPVKIQTVRKDTVYLPDTVTRYLTLPIERIEYLTSDYRAVIEGYKPKLTDMEIYPVTREITKNITLLKPSRWAVTLGAGYGVNTEGRVSPYIGVSAGYVFWSK